MHHYATFGNIQWIIGLNAHIYIMIKPWALDRSHLLGTFVAEGISTIDSIITCIMVIMLDYLGISVLIPSATF